MYLKEKGCEKWFGRVLGLLFLLPVLPLLWRYFEDQEFGQRLNGIPGIFLFLFLTVLVAFFPWGAPRSRPEVAAIGASLLISTWSLGSGLVSWALYFGLAALVMWREFCLQERMTTRLVAQLALLYLIILPFVPVEPVQLFRQISLNLVDLMLAVLPLHVEHIGITYQAGDVAIVVATSCSGITTIAAFFLLLASLDIYRRCYKRVVLITPLAAIILGILSNSLRIATYIVLSLLHGETLSEGMHQGIGGCFFAFFLFAFLLLTDSSRKEAPSLSPRWPVRCAPVLMVLILSLSSLMFESSLPTDKRMLHQYKLVSSGSFGSHHLNYFVEYPGAASWRLLEHSIDLCLAIRGWDLDKQREQYNRAGQALLIQTSYQIGQRQFSDRTAATLALWASPSLWRKPLWAKIHISAS